MVDEQQRKIGGGSRGGEGHRPDTEILDAFESIGVPIGSAGSTTWAPRENLGTHLFGVAHDQPGR